MQHNNFHVILIEPKDNKNIGAVARAMSNLGFANLHLIAPQNYDATIASVTACWGNSVLNNLQIHGDFNSAIADIEHVIALSGRDAAGKNPAHHLMLPEWTQTLVEYQGHQTGLVFGTEAHGLSNEHLSLCRRVVRIPASVENPSFNLAQSVLLTLYEISRELGDVYSEMPATPPLPTGNDYVQLERLLDAVMIDGGFIRSGSPAPTADTVKSLFRRMEMTEQEMGILLGLFGRVHTTLVRQKPKPPQ
jgi:TrmH family RNA methyltransferase